MGGASSCQINSINWRSFVNLVQNAEAYITFANCVFNDREQDVLIDFFNKLNCALVNSKGYPWDSCGTCGQWQRSQEARQFFYRSLVIINQFNTEVGNIYEEAEQGAQLIERWNEYDVLQKQNIARFLLAVRFVFVSQNRQTNVGTAFFQNNLIQFIFRQPIDPCTLGPANVNPMAFFISGLTKVFLVGKSVSCGIGKLIVAPQPFILIEGRLRRIVPCRKTCEGKTCAPCRNTIVKVDSVQSGELYVSNGECAIRVNGGIFYTEGSDDCPDQCIVIKSLVDIDYGGRRIMRLLGSPRAFDYTNRHVNRDLNISNREVEVEVDSISVEASQCGVFDASDVESNYSGASYKGGESRRRRRHQNRSEEEVVVIDEERETVFGNLRQIIANQQVIMKQLRVIAGRR